MVGRYFNFREHFLIGVILLGNMLLAQEEQLPLSTVTDSLYREDQFYIGLTYNVLIRQPEDMSQKGFSSGFHFGFIRDMPINKSRTLSIGMGLGASLNSYSHNLLINESDTDEPYKILSTPENQFRKNKMHRYLLELPIEFRWRKSTPENYNFWRIYTGFKMGYLFHDVVKFESEDTNFKDTNIESFNKFQYGLSLSAGYGTWNLYVYYGLNSIFSNKAKISGETLSVSTIKVGLMFYIL
ncbi:MAG: porin family protein [Aestuariibaculum sp.]